MAAELEETARRVGEAGQRALALPADVSDGRQLSEALSLIAAEWGAVDVLVNNAAVVWPLGPSATLDPEAWASSFAINVIAPARTTWVLLPAMLERGWGRIVNVSSGVVARPESMIGANAYVTAKAALEAHTRNLAAVDTGTQSWIRDQRPDAIGTELHARFTRAHADGAPITPEQSADALLALLPGDETGRVWDTAGARVATRGAR